jgi:electron transport complex protein RnfC
MFEQKKQKTFSHGVHPPDFKEDTRHLPVHQFPFAPVMVIPMAQHIGKPALPVVKEGQEVIRGQLIAKADGFFSSPIHAPASGIIKKISLVPSIHGNMTPGLFLQPFPGSTQEVLEGTPCSVDSASPEEIINAIQQAGIVGLGGAVFPTHAKLKVPQDKHVDTLLVNGAECEPYLTTDHRVMLEQSADIFLGIRYLLKATGAKRAVIGIEANKSDAAEHLQATRPGDIPVDIEVLPVKYPQGAEKIMIKALFNREIPAGGHAYDVHVVGVNVATTAEIGRLLPHGRGIQERVITITGPAVKKKGNYRMPIGTPIRFALDYVGTHDNISEIILGGPMMGPSVPNLDIPVTKGIGAIIAFGERDTGIVKKSFPCIRCGYCVEACPVSLNPAHMAMLAQKQQYQEMADNFHLKQCFECGACAYVCPAHIPLVQHFRMAKTMLKKNKMKNINTA